MRVLALFFGALLWAQEPGPAKLAKTGKAERLVLAEQWIQDSCPLYKAWAAELIRSDHIEGLTPQLLAALGDPPQVDAERWSEENRAQLAILDALIEIGASVPAVTVKALFSRYPAQALLLANRPGTWSPELMFGLLRLAKSDECWLAIGNRLTSGINPGVAAWLLRDLRVTASIEVEVQGIVGGVPGGIPGGVAGCEFGGIIGPVPDGVWPPPSGYELTIGPCDGCAVFADGPNPIYYVRGIDWREPGSCRKRNAYVHEYLARLLSVPPERLPISLQPKLIHKWTTLENYRSSGLAFVAEQEKSFREVAEQLFLLRYLTTEEWQNARLSLAINVSDHRGYLSAPLPELSK
jgi:hypothetical protein